MLQTDTSADDAPGTDIQIQDFSDVDAAPMVVSGRDKRLVAAAFRDGLLSWADAIVWLPDWLVDDVDDTLAPMNPSDNLFMVALEDYSADAWRLAQPERGHDDPMTWAPKSWAIVFEAGSRLEGVDEDQATVTSW